MDEKELESYFKEFDQLGESFVRAMIASDTWALKVDKSKHGAAIEWARQKDEERALAASKIRDEREEQTLKIAEEANRIAVSALNETSLHRRSNLKWTIITVTIAAASMIITAIANRAAIWSVIQRLLRL